MEFGSEAEADKQHSKLQPLIADGQLNQINFVGEKEREFQSNNRGVDNTRLFVRGIGSATEADIEKLFPTAISIIVRGTNQARGKFHQHKYCFVVFATAAACTKALEKSKGLTLFGNPLTINYAFLRKAPAPKRPRPKRDPPRWPMPPPKRPRWSPRWRKRKMTTITMMKRRVMKRKMRMRRKRMMTRREMMTKTMMMKMTTTTMTMMMTMRSDVLGTMSGRFT